MSSLNGETDGSIKDYEYGKEVPPASPMLNLQILPCDYNRGWTWYLQIGQRNFTGWQPVPGEKPQSSPEEAFANFMEWANKIGVEKLKEMITGQQKNKQE